MLDAGHAKVTGERLLEWEFNNDMQYRLKTRLEQLGFIVYLVNPNPGQGSEVSLATRCNLANKYWVSKGKPKTCLYVSLHANAAGSSGWSTARGVEVYASKSCSVASKNAAKKTKKRNNHASIISPAFKYRLSKIYYNFHSISAT